MKNKQTWGQLRKLLEPAAASFLLTSCTGCIAVEPLELDHSWGAHTVDKNIVLLRPPLLLLHTRSRARSQ